MTWHPRTRRLFREARTPGCHKIVNLTTIQNVVRWVMDMYVPRQETLCALEAYEPTWPMSRDRRGHRFFRGEAKGRDCTIAIFTATQIG